MRENNVSLNPAIKSNVSLFPYTHWRKVLHKINYKLHKWKDSIVSKFLVHTRTYILDPSDDGRIIL